MLEKQINMAKSKKSLRERMMQRKKELNSRGGGNKDIEYIKEEGTIRVRILPVDADDEMFIRTVTSFYLGKDLGSIYSPDTNGQPCALKEAWEELKEENNSDDVDLIKSLTPRESLFVPVIIYKDLKGKKIDEEKGVKLLKISKGVGQTIIDLFLDEDEWGDMTDPKKGYDIKITRTGKGLHDTEYECKPCKNTPIPVKKYHKIIDVEEMIEKIIATYDETVEARDKYLNLDTEEDDKPKKKKKRLSSKKKKGKSTTTKKKRRKKSDI